MKNRGRIAILLGAAVLALVGGALWLSPYWTLSAMRDAVQKDDMATIDAHIDYDALRQNLKTQITDKIRQQAKAAGGGEAGVKLAMILASGQIDQLVSQESVRTMIAGGKEAKDSGLMKDATVEVTRTGLTSFLAGAPNENGPPGGAEFTLEGLTWRITGIRIPEKR